MPWTEATRIQNFAKCLEILRNLSFVNPSSAVLYEYLCNSPAFKHR